MSECFSLYLVHEDLLPTDVVGKSDEEIHAMIVEAVQKHGKLYDAIEMTEDDFVDALESIDTIMEGNRLLPNCAMNNSPFQVLDKNSECPFIGYFDPAQTQELYYLFEGLSEESIDTIQSVETHSVVFDVFLDAAGLAMGEDEAIAILHA